MRGSRIFCQGRGGGGGGGVQARQPENSLDDFVFFFFFFFFKVLNLFYTLQRGSNGFITEKTKLFQWGPTFFQRGEGPNVNFYRNPYNLSKTL